MNEKNVNDAEVKCKSTEIYDLIRVIATVMVVIGHSGYTTWTGDGGCIELNTAHAAGVWNTGIFIFFNHLRDWIYGFHMPLFFFLSGAVYVYSKKRSSFDILVENKIYRLIVPYYLAGLFWMIPIKFLSGFYDKSNILDAVDMVMTGNWNGHLWFLLTLFWCFILFYGFEKYICRKSMALAGVCIIFVYYLNVQDTFASIPAINAIPGLCSSFFYFPWFFIGYLFERGG